MCTSGVRPHYPTIVGGEGQPSLLIWDRFSALETPTSGRRFGTEAAASPRGREFPGPPKLIQDTRGDRMNQVTVYDPFADTGIDELFRGFFRPVRFEKAAPATIKMDVTEQDNAYLVKAEIPGVAKENIQVSIEGNQVTIGAEVKREKDVKDGERVLRSERYYGNSYRAFTLPVEVD